MSGERIPSQQELAELQRAILAVGPDGLDALDVVARAAAESEAGEEVQRALEALAPRGFCGYRAYGAIGTITGALGRAQHDRGALGGAASILRVPGLSTSQAARASGLALLEAAAVLPQVRETLRALSRGPEEEVEP